MQGILTNKLYRSIIIICALVYASTWLQFIIVRRLCEQCRYTTVTGLKKSSALDAKCKINGGKEVGERERVDTVEKTKKVKYGVDKKSNHGKTKHINNLTNREYFQMNRTTGV